MTKNRKDNSGATLIELMLAMGILLVISYMVLSITLANRTSSSITQARIFLNSQAQQVGLNLAHEFTEAQSSTVYLTDGFNDNGVTKYRSLGFKIPIIDANGNLLDTNGEIVDPLTGYVAFGDGQVQGNYINYALVGTNLIRRILASDKTTILSTITIAQNLLPVTGFKVQSITGTARFDTTLTFSINSYIGISLPSTLSLDTTISITPKN